SRHRTTFVDGPRRRASIIPAAIRFNPAPSWCWRCPFNPQEPANVSMATRPDLNRLYRDFWELRPDPSDAAHRVSFGTSGHRGTSARGSFNEAHVLAITQAVCDYRTGSRITGPLYLGK